MSIEGQLAELEAAEKAATPGPWTASPDDDKPEAGDVVVWGPTEDWLLNVGNWARQNPDATPEQQAQQFVEMRDEADARFIAAARNTLAALLREVRLLHGRVDDLGCSCAERMADGWKENAHLGSCLLRPNRKLGEV